MDKPYSEFDYDNEDNNIQDDTDIQNHYNNLGIEFILFGSSLFFIFYNIYCIFKGKTAHCCLKRKFKQKTLETKLLDECSICLADMEEKDKIIILECDHIYHKDCIMEWFERGNINCPMCREKLFK